VELLRQHSDASYTKSDKAIYGSSIGCHVRHVLDHYNAFVKAVESGVLAYDDRERNTKVENDRSCAIAAFESSIKELEALEDLPDGGVDVAVAASTQESQEISRSSLARELQFLVSHTVHHFALIAIASRVQGIIPGSSFGVAPSTLKYMSTVKA
tara:strand:- start:115 stop:579 length:465 start_codon:yes stop_codon:yes gene_type:complete